MAIIGTAAFVAFLVIGNVIILSVHAWAAQTASDAAAPVSGIKNMRVVDDKLWRGSAPTESAYKKLAEAGVTTIVDLRAEVEVSAKRLEKLGIELVSLPIRDGQLPNEEQVEEFLDAVESSKGIVYVHCMAGVGRTGAMVAAYTVRVMGSSNMTALRSNLSVGPPSLEQIAYVVGDMDKPNPVVTVFSRVLDGPRRIWSSITP